jgi:hypothetical protein
MKTRAVINIGMVLVLVLAAVAILSFQIGFERGKDAAIKLNETTGALLFKTEMLGNASTQVSIARALIDGKESDIGRAKKMLKISLEHYQSVRDYTIANDMFKRSFFNVVEKDVTDVLAELSAEP